ncbi:MAG: crotonase/enoyl-CoA hydratase family protein [Cytophagales bacterium]|nr:crotonase/enoyl-CoA hydratase family protein [Bernardetiaceae bacterium]MDW8210978.1 crotonase/enoyl-CoA hydratase family protein [Cytophagales bacterium]
MYTRFHLQISNFVAEVTICRPEKANAMDEPAWEEMRAIFNDLSQNDQVRAVILKAEGKHFCAGIDLDMFTRIKKRLEQVSPDEGYRREYLRRNILDLQACINAIEQCSKPVLAAIEGHCIGGGVDIVCAADMRYCTKEAIFSIGEINLGMVADLGTLQRMPRLIPPGIVAELAYTGRAMTGTEAQAYGFVNGCFESQDALLSAVRHIASQIAAQSPLSIRGIKEMLRHGRDHTIAEGLRYVATWNAAMLLSADLQEALAGRLKKH